MRARLCAAMLFFEAILLGLSTPVMITVEDVDRQCRPLTVVDRGALLPQQAFHVEQDPSTGDG